MLDALSNGLIATFNGLWAMTGGLISLRVALGVAIVGSLAWLAAIEIEELDREGTRPGVRRH
jgi:hypothetical protein